MNSVLSKQDVKPSKMKIKPCKVSMDEQQYQYDGRHALNVSIRVKDFYVLFLSLQFIYQKCALADLDMRQKWWRIAVLLLILINNFLIFFTLLH